MGLVPGNGDSRWLRRWLGLAAMFVAVFVGGLGIAVASGGDVPEASIWLSAGIAGVLSILGLWQLIASCRRIGERRRCEITTLRNKVAELSRFNETLRHSKAKMRGILQTAVDGIISINEKGIVEDMNPAAERMFHYPAKDVVGRNISMLMPAPYREEHDRYLADYLRTGKPKVIGIGREAEGLRRDGTTFPMDLAVSEVWIDDRRMFTGIVRDITQRKQTEQALANSAEELRTANESLARAWQKADAATRAKSEFLANVSHEIRTPMTAILGFTEVLMETATEGDAADAARTIYRNGQHLVQIINDILDLSKIEAGQMALERIECSPIALADEVIESMRFRAASKNLSLEVELSGLIPEVIRTDPTRLRQVLINLLGNALKFTEVGGVRMVVRMSEDQHKPRLMEFSVIDTGIGIDEKQLANLFIPFSQADNSTTRRFGGTGLGLAICQRLTQILGGNLTVQSELGRGSAFTARIDPGPLSEALLSDQTQTALRDAGDNAPAPPVNAVLAGCRILLVEDSPDSQRLFHFVLKKAGGAVDVAENGREAIDKVLELQGRGEHYDVILMDMQMPVLDGYEAARILREQGIATPIAALTAHAMSGDREKCLDAGCDDYAPKPVDREKLLALVASLTARQLQFAS